MSLSRRQGRSREFRPSARLKGVLYSLAPIGCPDANEGEVAKAIYALGKEAGVVIGRGSGYDSIKDEYAVVGKSLETGRAQDFKIAGAEVASLIGLARMLAGGPMRLARNRHRRQVKRPSTRAVP